MTYIYIYIEREREREKEMSKWAIRKKLFLVLKIRSSLILAPLEKMAAQMFAEVDVKRREIYQKDVETCRASKGSTRVKMREQQITRKCRHLYGHSYVGRAMRHLISSHY